MAKKAIKTTPKETKEPVRGRQSAAPTCPYCKVRCRANGSSPFFTRYYCFEVGCNYSEKVARPKLQESMTRKPQEEEIGAARD